MAPKALGLIAAMIDAKTRRASGGAIRLFLSGLLEAVLSALLAPIMMLIQSGSVVQILSGRDTGWNPQRRDDGSIPFKSIVRRHRAHALLGLVTLFAAWLISPSLVVWMSPTIAGLLLAIPLSWASGQLWIGVALRKVGLLTTPEETAPPPIVLRSNALADELAMSGADSEDGLRAVHCSQVFRAQHDMFLPTASRRRRGEIDVEEAVAAAKLNEARTFEEASGWLKPKERMALLNDRALIAMLARLPSEAAQAPSIAAQ
jgi:membrane glycosyltransferase